MLGRGELERAVAEVLWDSPAPMSARAVADSLPGRELAVTTVLTVLARLESKGIVSRTRDGRAHAYQATASREDHTVELMRQVMAGAGDREAVLSRFVGTASEDEIAALRRAIDGR